MKIDKKQIDRALAWDKKDLETSSGSMPTWTDDEIFCYILKKIYGNTCRYNYLKSVNL